MKKLGYLTCAALLAFASCTNEINEEGFVDKANTISFNAYANKTRAAVGADITTDNMKGDNFGVVGYNADNNIYLFKGTYSAVEQKWQETSGSWEYNDMSDLKFWPEGTMDFYAYFPYSDNATFTATDASGDVMTIPNVDCTHDVLFAKYTTEYVARVPLTFHHALSKIKALQIEMPASGNVYKSKCQVEVQKVEIINTSTSGTVTVNNSGEASYTPSTPNVTFKEDLSSSIVTINNSNATPYLINNGDNAKGYLFATNSTATNNVKGTGKTMWDGVKANIGASGSLSTSDLVCLKLTCKVWNGVGANQYYYAGSASDYTDVYIPLNGTDTSSNTVTTFDAGKRYIYKIVFKDNVGFKDNGDPVLNNPILFSVSSVDSWDDVTVTITL